MNQPSEIGTNRLAIISALLALLAALSVCIGVAPIPLTAWVCYPLALALGVGALASGLVALRQVRVSGERGRRLALAGLWAGALGIAAVVCFTTLTVLVLYYGAETLHQVWPQLNP